MKAREWWIDERDQESYDEEEYQFYAARGDVKYLIHVREVMPDEPSTEDMEVALKVIDDLAVFAANHSCMTRPVEGLIRVTKWMRQLIGHDKGQE